jgi:hypothetical protein
MSSQQNRSQSKSNFQFYASLLDAYQNFLDSEEIYDKYWGHSEDPKFTYDEYADKQFVELINRINRVPFTNDAVEKGTALNNMVDMLIDGVTDNGQFVLQANEEKNLMTISEREIMVDDEGNQSETFKNEHSFLLPMVREFADYYDGALKQYFVKGTLDTCYGDVDLYGFIDYLLPFSYHDMKTARSYSAGSYKNHWQHIVYPFAGYQCGLNIERFEYNVTNFKETFTEVYMFKPERDIPRLRNMCELFIGFLLNNKELITDEKIFNYRKL